MKLKDGLILREVAGQYVIVPTGKRVQEIRGILYITKPAAFLWQYMQDNDFSKEDLIRITLEKFKGVNEERVREDIDKYIKALIIKGCMDTTSAEGDYALKKKKDEKDEI